MLYMKDCSNGMSGKDLVSGLVTPIVIIASTLSYAALIFSGPLAHGLPVGIGYGLICAGVMAITFALFSDLPFAIAGPDSKSAAVLATFAAACPRRVRSAATPALANETPQSGSWCGSNNRIAATGWSYDGSGNVTVVGGTSRTFSWNL